jgi:hypothetical protein
VLATLATPVVTVEVGELADVVHFDVCRRAADLAAFGPEASAVSVFVKA